MSDATVERVLAAIAQPREPLDGSPAEVLAALTRRAEPGLTPLDGAVLRATRADRLGYAFAAGYVAAGRTLAARIGAGLPEHARVALAASEEGGAHPRAIHTAFDGQTLSGAKVWITLALEATHLLVIAKAGEEGGRPRLIAACVPSEREGLRVEELPEAPFCPEIRHARLTLQAVRVAPEELLPEDGFADVLHSAVLKISAVGTYDMPTDQLDMIWAVSPFRSYSQFLKSIPLFGRLVAGDRKGLATALFQVKGSIDDPQVTYLPMKSFTTGLTGVAQLAFDVLKNTVMLPIDILTPHEEKEPLFDPSLEIQTPPSAPPPVEVPTAPAPAAP